MLPLNSPLRISPAGFGGKVSHWVLLRLFRNDGSCQAFTISSGDNWTFALALEAANPNPKIPKENEKNLRRSILILHKTYINKELIQYTSSAHLHSLQYHQQY